MSVDELLEGVKAELAVKLFGEDLGVLKERADAIAAVAAGGARGGGYPGRSGHRHAAALDPSGLRGHRPLRDEPFSDVQQTIRAAVGGQEAGQVFEGVRRFDILVRYTPEARDSPDAIGDILVASPNGARVPLSDLADIQRVTGPRQITREDTQRFITIQNNVVGRDIGSFVKPTLRPPSTPTSTCPPATSPPGAARSASPRKPTNASPWSSLSHSA